MSQEHIAYRVADSFNRRDFDALLALTDDDVEVVTRAAVMEGGYHGHDGVRRFWEDWLSVFPDSSIEIVEVRDVGDVMFAATRVVGHGTRSGTPLVEETVWQAVRWRQGKVAWWGTFGTWAEALEAVSLSE
jgi:ketosteroid isomerase-like protein